MVIPLPLFWLWRLRYICCCLLWYTLHQPSSTSCFDMSIKTFCLHQMTVISYAMMIFVCINSLWHMLWRCVPWLCNINNLMNFRHYVNTLSYLDEYIWSYALYNQFGAKNGILYPPTEWCSRAISLALIIPYILSTLTVAFMLYFSTPILWHSFKLSFTRPS